MQKEQKPENVCFIYQFVHDACANCVNGNFANISKMLLLHQYYKHHSNKAHQTNIFVFCFWMNSIQYSIPVKIIIVISKTQVCTHKH